MRAFAKMPCLEVGRFQVHRLGGVEPVHAALLKAERATPQHTLEQLTEPAGKPAPATMKPKSKQAATRRFKEVKPTLTRVDRSAGWRLCWLRWDHTARCWSRNGNTCCRSTVRWTWPSRWWAPARWACATIASTLRATDPAIRCFCRSRRSRPPAYAPYLPDAHPAHHNGQRVAEGQRAMQMQSDPFLGWTHIGGRQYLVRQLNDHKGSIELEDLDGGGLEAYAEVCGELLARGHARSGDPLIIAGYLGSGDGFAEALAKFGSLYADQTEKDWEDLRRSRKVKGKP